MFSISNNIGTMSTLRFCMKVYLQYEWLQIIGCSKRLVINVWNTMAEKVQKMSPGHLFQVEAR